MGFRVVISSGHGQHVAGADEYINEVEEARRVVDHVADLLDDTQVDCVVFHDNTSNTQSENLDAIIGYHNAQTRSLDISVHFNAYKVTTDPRGVEVCYVTQQDLAERMAVAIAEAGGFINRGAKQRNDLAFLNSTTARAILIEVCFVDSRKDVQLYQHNFHEICQAIVDVIEGESETGDVITAPSPDALLHVSGSCSWFGGPDDDGVDAEEGLAFIYEVEDAPHLFLPQQPEGATGLARRLDPGIFYVACRWNYDVTPKEMLRDQTRKARVSANGKSFLAFPADWGPHEDTGRVADLSPALMDALDATTDDEVEVIYPA
jgi:N-acetylmuramoyl-L-alanine amidase